MRMNHVKKIDCSTIQLYIAHHALLHPLTYAYFVEQLTFLENKGKICLVPLTVLERFHIKLKKVG